MDIYNLLVGGIYVTFLNEKYFINQIMFVHQRQDKWLDLHVICQLIDKAARRCRTGEVHTSTALASGFFTPTITSTWIVAGNAAEVRSTLCGGYFAMCVHSTGSKGGLYAYPPVLETY